MNVSKLFEKKDIVVSFEIFPPKPTSPISTVYDTLDALGDLNPHYISVTYGAGGTEKENSTVTIAKYIKNTLLIEPLAHLTCLGTTKEEIKPTLDQLEQNGIKNILALRGDRSEFNNKPGDFKYASELISFIKSSGDFNVVAGCYPEKHPEAPTLEQDIINLKNKVDCGASHLITQLFFDNERFYDFMDKTAKAGINVPVDVGIMPLTNIKQAQKMTSLMGVNVPKKHLKMLEKFGENPLAMREAGIVFAMEQIVDLIANGVKGIHIYTMNNPYVARRIMLYLHNIFSM